MHVLNPKKKTWLAAMTNPLIDVLSVSGELQVAKTGSPEEWGDAYIKAFLDHYGFTFGALQIDQLRWRLAQHVQIPHEYREFFERAALMLELMLGLAAFFGRKASAEKRLVEFATLLAVVYGKREIAHALGEYLSDLDEPKALPREVEKLLETLSKQLGGLADSWADPLYQKTLQGAFRFADTRLFGRLAADYYLKGCYDHLQMMSLYLDRIDEKRVLFQCVIGMVWADGELTYDEKALIRHLIHLSDLPPAVSDDLMHALKQHRPLPILDQEVTDDDTRRFIFRQVVLTSFADGVQEEHELRFIAELAPKLGISPEESDALQAEMLRYFEANEKVFDHSFWGTLNRFRLRMGAKVTGVVRRNVDRIMLEVSQTRELSALLAKATHTPLTPEEQRKVKEQLLDIAKTIPALAIFVIPGGSVVFAVLCKVLPFNLLPSAFADDAADGTAPVDPLSATPPRRPQ